MKILVIGLGSMGRRRIRLIKKYNSSYQIEGIEFNEQRRREVEKEYNIKTYQSIEESNIKNYDCAFISTPPLSHNELIRRCLDNNLHVFTELNLVDYGYDDNIALAKKRMKVLFLSSTFLYRDEINYISTKVKQQKCINYQYHVGQYLPDWHPWESYREYFVSNKQTNACRELFAIELPWIVDTFGEIKDIHTMKSRMSSLKIEYPDNYLIMIEHTTGNKGLLGVDIVSRKAVRNLEIYNENVYIKWDGTPDGLKEFNLIDKREKELQLYKEVDKLENYSSFVVENAYYNEIVNFFEVIYNQELPKYSFEMDKKILQYIDRIEEK
jgi:Predicted dehydrogenases and related proteins